MEKEHRAKYAKVFEEFCKALKGLPKAVLENIESINYKMSGEFRMKTKECCCCNGNGWIYRSDDYMGRDVKKVTCPVCEGRKVIPFDCND